MGVPARCVLVVDDAPDVGDFITVLIEQEGYRVLRAASGEEALEIVARDPPDVILLDLQLPGMDGFAVIEALRAGGALDRIAVIVLSASGEPGVEDRVIVAGARDYLPKPVAADLLLAAIAGAP